MSPALRFALPVLAVAGSAYAACSTSGTATVQNQGDASAIATCTTFSGNIAIATGTSNLIQFDGNLEKIDGDLTASSASALTGISGSNVKEITGKMELNDIQVLTSVSFPQLTTVKELRLNALANLQQLDFAAPLSKASTISIENTHLRSLQGINIETADTLNIANNVLITDISMQIKNVKSQLNINFNNPEVKVNFPNMEGAGNLTFKQCSSVLLPSLAFVNDTLGLISNSFSNFSAPNLTTVGGALALVANAELTNITFPELTDIKKNLQIANNTKLDRIDGLPKLKNIGASFDLNGNMTSVTMPALNSVVGAFNLQSTGDVSKSCDTFNNLKSKGNIEGDITCKGELISPGGEGTTPGETKGSDKKGAASLLNVPAATFLAGLAAALFL